MEVHTRQYDTPFDVPLSVAVAVASPGPEGGPRDTVVAAGFLPMSDLVARHRLTVLGESDGAVDEAVRAWLDGDASAIDDVPWLQSGTAFQQRVWDALMAVPAGTTCTYGELAEIVGHPGAARAVGSACGANAVAPFVPCHRVVPAGGRVGHYGYGPSLKSALLAWET